MASQKAKFDYAPAPESRSIVDIKPSYGLFIDGGVIVEQGPAKAVLNQPQHARTQDFLRRVLHPL